MSENNDIIAVFGATGTVGGLVAEGLIDRGIRPRLFSRSPERLNNRFGDRAEAVAADLSDTASLKEGLEGVHNLFLVSSVGEEMEDVQTGALETLSAAGISHVVRLSALGATPRSSARISRAHAAIDAALRKSAMKWTLLQPGFFMDNVLDFAPVIAEDGDLYAPAGDTEIAMIDARDIADVAVAALTDSEQQGLSHKLTGGAGVSYYHVAEAITRATGRRVEYVDVSPEEFRKMLLSAGVGEWEADGVLELYEGIRSHSKPFIADGVKKALGRAPRTIDDFAGTYAAAFA